ncbi:hypothetical protein [Fictibacillus nanhaiensis]|uniref:hypothetical protein n=1 Tax=Fictibacillus nanhaiensis TaxID=742169 RepID=UPI003C2568B4
MKLGEGQLSAAGFFVWKMEVMVVGAAAKNTPSHKNGGTSHKKEQASHKNFGLSHKNSHSSYKNKFQLITCTLQKDTATYSDSAFSFRSHILFKFPGSSSLSSTRKLTAVKKLFIFVQHTK